MTFPPSSFLVLHIIYHASVTLSMVFLKIFCEIYIFFRDFFGRFHQKTHISRRGRRKTPRNHKILILFSCFTSLSQRADAPSAPRSVSICRAGAQTAFLYVGQARRRRFSADNRKNAPRRLLRNVSRRAEGRTVLTWLPSYNSRNRFRPRRRGAFPRGRATRPNARFP